MRLLLDTHALVWAATAPARLSRHARAAIQDSGNERLVSVLSIYEIDYKRAVDAQLERLPANLNALCDSLVFSWLRLDELQAECAARLPRLHKDPWDRMIVAQALCEDLTLVSADRALAGYGVSILW